MNGSRRMNWLARAAAATAAALVLAGCGTTTMGPAAQAPGASAPELVSQSGGTGTFVPAPVLDQEGALASGTLSLAAVTSSATLNGAVGGQLTCGRFAVNVLPGAFVGTGTVTMTMRDPTVAIVDLSIAPSVLNDFKVAVDLSYDPTGLGLTSPVTIYWFDGKKWVDLVAKPDSKTGFPTVHLKHFSPYGAGKAGW